MRLFNSRSQYGLVSKLLHWLIAILMLIVLGIGWRMVELSYYDPWYHDALLWHKSLGMLIGLVVMAKLGWRLISPPPALQPSLSSLENGGAILVHGLLWLGMLVLPISGYLISSSEGAAIEVFNWFQVKAWFAVSDAVRDSAIRLHYYLAYTLVGLTGLHMGAALKHQFIDKKATLKRML